MCTSQDEKLINLIEQHTGGLPSSVITPSTPQCPEMMSLSTSYATVIPVESSTRSRINRDVLVHDNEPMSSTPSILVRASSGGTVREKEKATITTASRNAAVTPLEDVAAMTFGLNKERAPLTAMFQQQDVTKKEHYYRDYSRLPIEDLRDPSSFIYGAASSKEPPFPLKLHQILSNPDYQDMVCWLPHGRSWRVLKPKAFEEKVIPQHFRHCRYASFMRQVNGWGFKRVLRGPDLNSYYHEFFLRGLPHLSLKMHRPVGGGKPNVNASSDGSGGVKTSVPDFYSISARFPLPDYHRTTGFNEDANAVVAAPANSEIGGRHLLPSVGLGDKNLQEQSQADHICRLMLPRERRHSNGYAPSTILSPCAILPSTADLHLSRQQEQICLLQRLQLSNPLLNVSGAAGMSGGSAGDLATLLTSLPTPETGKLAHTTLHSASGASPQLDHPFARRVALSAMMQNKTLPDSAVSAGFFNPSVVRMNEDSTAPIAPPIDDLTRRQYQEQNRTEKLSSATDDSSSPSEKTFSLRNDNTHPKLTSTQIPSMSSQSIAKEKLSLSMPAVNNRGFASSVKKFDGDNDNVMRLIKEALATTTRQGPNRRPGIAARGA